jgi:signal transduction histidine kinase
MTTKTILKIPGGTPSLSAEAALRGAGIAVEALRDWRDAEAALRNGEASLVMLDAHALGAITSADSKAGADGLPRDVAQKLSHDLRTPLSAMAGWLHLMESGTLDAAALKRVIGKLKGNIDDQVRTIDRYLGAHREGRS